MPKNKLSQYGVDGRLRSAESVIDQIMGRKRRKSKKKSKMKRRK